MCSCFNASANKESSDIKIKRVSIKLNFALKRTTTFSVKTLHLRKITLKAREKENLLKP